MIDLDFFKRINDTYGHDAGDRVLCGFGTCTTAVLRPSDLFARTGGEEFACLLPNTNMTDALETADRIRRRFASQTGAHGILPDRPDSQCRCRRDGVLRLPTRRPHGRR